MRFGLDFEANQTLVGAAENRYENCMNVCDAGRKGIAVSTAVVEFQGVGMSDQQNGHHQSSDVSASSAGVSTRRRKLVRAGLAAAPVVAAFKTNMVLAQTSGGNTAVLASSYASVAANGGSVAPMAQTTGLFLPMTDCKTQADCDKLLFGTDHCDGSDKRGCGFDPVIDPVLAKKKLSQIFSLEPANDLQRLAQYLSAGYLSAKKYGSDSYISESRCKHIWTSRGSWEPTAGIRWTLQDTCAYFDKVYSGTGFSECLTSPSTGSKRKHCG